MSITNKKIKLSKTCTWIWTLTLKNQRLKCMFSPYFTAFWRRLHRTVMVNLKNYLQIWEIVCKKETELIADKLKLITLCNNLILIFMIKIPVDLHPSSYFIVHETYSLVKFTVFNKHRFGSGSSVKHIFFLNSMLFYGTKIK